MKRSHEASSEGRGDVDRQVNARKRKRFAALLCAYLIWLGALLVLYFTTVR